MRTHFPVQMKPEVGERGALEPLDVWPVWDVGFSPGESWTEDLGVLLAPV